jgi:hypothetical protein
VPRHVAQLVTRPAALLVVDYSASRRLVVDYFGSAARPGASAPRAARHAARRAARRRLLRLAQARRRLLHLRRASGCLGTSGGSSRGSSRCSSSTTSLLPRVRMPRHVTRLVALLVVDFSTSRRLVVDYSTSRRLVVDNSASCRLVIDYATSHRLVVDYFAYAARPGASARRAAHTACRAARRRLLRLRRASGCVSIEVPTKGGLSRRATCLTQFTTKANWFSLRKLHKGGVIQTFSSAPHGEGTQRATPNRLEASFKSNKRKSINQSHHKCFLRGGSEDLSQRG